MLDRQAAIPVAPVERRPQALGGRADETGDVVRSAEHGNGLAPFRENVVRPQPPLGEDRARPRHPVARVPPSLVHFVFHVPEIELALLDRFGYAAAAQQNRLHNGVHDLVAVGRQGHGHAQLLADLGCLAQDHLEHGAVHGVVFAVEHQRAHRGRRLPETIGAALALLVAGRVPGEIVMDHRIEPALQVDAF